MINRDEKLTIEKILLLTTLFVQPFFAYAQTAKQDWTKRWSIEAKGGWGYMIPCDEYAQELIRTHHSSVYSLQMSHRALATDSCQYDQLFGFPSLSVGLLFADYHRIKLQKENTPYISGTGYMMGAYASFSRDLLRTDRFSFNYTFENGLGWCSKPYDGFTNEDNELIGSPLSIYFGFGLYARYRITPQWELVLGGELKHFSNGAVDRPNKGINTTGVSLGAKYYLQPTEPTKKMVFKVPFDSYFFMDLSAGWDVNSSMGEWLINSYHTSPDSPNYHTKDYRIYSGVTAHATAMYRYSRRYASGIGLDYTYYPYTDALQEEDEKLGYQNQTYNKHSVALVARHEVYYRRLTMYMGLAYYLLRERGGVASEFEKPYYENLGIKYALTRNGNIYIGYHVKAHLLRAEHMELNLGFRIKTGNGRKEKIW